MKFINSVTLVSSDSKPHQKFWHRNRTMNGKRWSSQVSSEKKGKYLSHQELRHRKKVKLSSEWKKVKLSSHKKKQNLYNTKNSQDYKWEKVKLSSLYQKGKYYYKVSKTSNNKQILACNCKWIIIKIMNFSPSRKKDMNFSPSRKKDKEHLPFTCELTVWARLGQVYLLLVLLSGCLGWLLKVTGGQWLLSCLPPVSVTSSPGAGEYGSTASKSRPYTTVCISVCSLEQTGPDCGCYQYDHCEHLQTLHPATSWYPLSDLQCCIPG